MVTKFQKKHIALLVSAACALGSTAVSAAESNEKSDKKIEKIEVKGQRILGVDVVDLSDIRKKQANDLEDIFRGEPSITVGGSFGIAQKVYVRGVEDTNLNVSVDGATQAGYLFHHQGRLSIEPEMLKHVEVKAGAGTALDGPGALGGAIRFETKDPQDLLQGDEQFGALLKVGYFSNTQGRKLSGSFFGKFNEEWSALAIIGNNDTDNIEDGNGVELQNTKTDQDLGLVKVKGQISEDHLIKLSHEIRNDDGFRNVRPHFYAAGWNSANEQKSRRETSTLNYFYTPDSDAINVAFTAYHTDAYLTQNEGNERHDGAGVKSIGFDLRNSALFGDHQVTYGADYRRDTGYYIKGSEGEEVGKVLGIYAQDTIEVSQNLSVSFGARFDDYQLDDADGQSYDSSGFSPNINAIYEFTPHWSVKGSYSQALRGQKVKEAYLIGFRKNAPDLKEEKADNIDFTLAYDKDGLLVTAQAFKSTVDDVVATVRREEGRFFGNAGELETTGFSLSISQQWENAQVGLSYSHNKPELNGEPLDDGNMGIGTAFGDSLTLNSSYSLEEYNLELGWNARLVKSLTDVPAGNPDKPGYGVHDLYVEWYPVGGEDFYINLSVNNAFDKYFHDHGTFGWDSDDERIIGLAEPGRDVRLTLSYQF